MLNERPRYRVSCQLAHCGSETPGTQGPNSPVLGPCLCPNANLAVYHSVHPFNLHGAISTRSYTDAPNEWQKHEYSSRPHGAYLLAVRQTVNNSIITLCCENCCQGCDSLNLGTWSCQGEEVGWWGREGSTELGPEG